MSKNVHKVCVRTVLNIYAMRFIPREVLSRKEESYCKVGSLQRSLKYWRSILTFSQSSGIYRCSVLLLHSSILCYRYVKNRRQGLEAVLLMFIYGNKQIIRRINIHEVSHNIAKSYRIESIFQ